MPFGDEDLEQGLALALSGGGYRATLFHVGVLWRLNELALLTELKRVSSVSGGSITAAIFATKWDRLKFQNNVATAFKAEVADPLIEFTSHIRPMESNQARARRNRIQQNAPVTESEDRLPPCRD